MFEIKITESKFPEDLANLVRLCRNTAPLMKSVGRTAANVFQDHFLELNSSKANARGFKRTNFWSKIRKATHFDSSDATSATIAIANPAFAAKVNGAVIFPRDTTKLAIPISEKAYGKSPSSQNENFRNSLKLIPRKGKCSLLVTQTKAQAKKGEFTLHYILLESVFVRKDPDALPKNSILYKAINEEISEYLKTEK